MTLFIRGKPARNAGWYVGWDPEGPLEGPFEAADIAIAAARAEEPDEPGEPHVDYLQNMSIFVSIFRAEYLLEQLEELNEEACWLDALPDWPRDHFNELETNLEAVLYNWLEKHDLWKQFRSLESAPRITKEETCSLYSS